MAITKVPIKLPTMHASGRWGPNDGSDKFKSFFYYVQDGDNWGSVAAKDGWSDVKAFIRYNLGTEDPPEVNWYLSKYVGCKLQTSDGFNYRFSKDASPGYIFTRNNLQPSMQPMSNGPAMPRGTGKIDDDIKLKPVYGPPKSWFLLGVKVGGMAGPLGGDLIALAGVGLSGPVEGFSAVGYTSRIGGGLGASAGFTIGFVTHMQHPNQLIDYEQGERSWDANIAVGIKAGSLHKIGPMFNKGGPLHSLASGMGRLVARGNFDSTQGVTAMLSSIKGIGQTVFNSFTTEPGFNATLIDVPFGGVGTEISVFKARTGFEPMRTITRTPEGDLVDQTITPTWLYQILK